MKVSYEPGVSQVWLNTTINMRANFGLVLIATKIIITTVMILQVVLDGLEDRGHKVDKVDKFGSVVVGIGDCHHYHYHHIVSLVDKLCGGWNWSLPSFSQHCHFSQKKIVIYFQSGARRESLKQMLTSEKLVLLLATRINP